MRYQLLTLRRYYVLHSIINCITFDLSIKKYKSKTQFMKKFLFAAQVFLIMAMVPAAVYAYLHTNDQNQEKGQHTEMARDVTNGQESANSFSLVKLF